MDLNEYAPVSYETGITPGVLGQVLPDGLTDADPLGALDKLGSFDAGSPSTGEVPDEILSELDTVLHRLRSMGLIQQ